MGPSEQSPPKSNLAGDCSHGPKNGSNGSKKADVKKDMVYVKEYK